MDDHKQIVIAGAGHAALIALDLLAREPAAGAAITLISRGSASRYSGLMPGWIEGLYGDDAMAIPLDPLVQRAGVRRIDGEIAGIDANAVRLADGRVVPFDALVLNTGSVSPLEGPLDHPRVIAARPVELLGGRLGPHLDVAGSFAVVGAGVAGLETAFALKARHPEAAVTLVERERVLLPAFPRGFARAIGRALMAHRIALKQSATVTAVRDHHISLSDGSVAPADCVLALSGAAPPPWMAATPFEKAGDGFVATDGAMRSISHPHVIVVGDAGTSLSEPRPKAGVFAVRAGPHVAAAIRAIARGEPPPPVQLQRRGLVLLATGGRSAVGTRNGITLSGRWVWRLKDWLDRGFVARFED